MHIIACVLHSNFVVTTTICPTGWVNDNIVLFVYFRSTQLVKRLQVGLLVGNIKSLHLTEIKRRAGEGGVIRTTYKTNSTYKHVVVHIDLYN